MAVGAIKTVPSMSVVTVKCPIGVADASPAKVGSERLSGGVGGTYRGPSHGHATCLSSGTRP
jgi:hypothetical protein